METHNSLNARILQTTLELFQKLEFKGTLSKKCILINHKMVLICHQK